jgi:hypothetical protein
MTAVKVKLPTIEQGATYSHTIKWMQPGGLLPIDMSGAKGYMQVRETIDSINSVLDLNSDNGRIAIDTVTGTITLSIPAVVTELLTPITDAVYDLEIHYSDLSVVRLIEGKVSIKAEVTRG